MEIDTEFLALFRQFLHNTALDWLSKTSSKTTDVQHIKWTIEAVISVLFHREKVLKLKGVQSLREELAKVLTEALQKYQVSERMTSWSWADGFDSDLTSEPEVSDEEDDSLPVDLELKYDLLDPVFEMKVHPFKGEVPANSVFREQQCLVLYQQLVLNLKKFTDLHKQPLFGTLPFAVPKPRKEDEVVDSSDEEEEEPELIMAHPVTSQIFNTMYKHVEVSHTYSDLKKTALIQIL